MSLTSFGFFVFCGALLAAYYLCPKKLRWCVLLAFSLVFYAFSGAWNLLYIITTAFSAWIGALCIEKIGKAAKAYIKANKQELSSEEKTAIKARAKKKKKSIMVLVLFLNFGLLCYFKYANFALGELSALLRLFGGEAHFDALSLAVPLGISFYTFQTMGYLVDVYWEKSEACKNPLKLLLFTSFFAGVTQGPISSYNALATQLYSPKPFDADAWLWGGRRMIWGFFKKIAVADVLAPYVLEIFAHYDTYSGITALLGAFFYSIQIYADFSGYMDIVCGLCQMMGIRLTENFVRPYFSKSIAEYWRRWHISLGDWFKTYIYYPIAVSKWNMKLGQKTSGRLGKFIGGNLSATIALVAVWLTTGLWHGANWGYIAWGGINGLFIIFSMWMEPFYTAIKKTLRINEAHFMYRAFQVIRTFILVTFIKVLPEVGGLRAGLGLWKKALTDHTLPASLTALLPAVDHLFLPVAAIGTLLMLTVSLLERKKPVRERMDKLPALVRICMLGVLVATSIIVAFYSGSERGGFMYAQF